MKELVIRSARIGLAKPTDVTVVDGRIVAIGPAPHFPIPTIDARRGALLPGLADHHIHLLAAAARRTSVLLDGVSTPDALAAAIGRAAAARAAGSWIRATGYDEAVLGLPDADALQTLAPKHPLRMLDRTGALWMLNRAALARLGNGPLPSAVERGADGRPTGRIWRGDAWLRDRIGPEWPDLAPLGDELARYGVTHVTDASAGTDAVAAAILGSAHENGTLPQHLTLMSAGPLPLGQWRVGPVKLLLDERDLPSLDEMVALIKDARRQGRAVAVHCVTAVELALTLAALEVAGPRLGDRIEHGSVIPHAAIATIAEMGLQVVSQPGFLYDRGDRYLRSVPDDERPDLHRLESLRAAAVGFAGSSDAPYATLDPWKAMQAATERRTRANVAIGEGERLSPKHALLLYLGDPADPAGPRRRVAVGQPADLCLLRVPLRVALARPDASNVAATIIAGKIVYLADRDRADCTFTEPSAASIPARHDRSICEESRP